MHVGKVTRRGCRWEPSLALYILSVINAISNCPWGGEGVPCSIVSGPRSGLPHVREKQNFLQVRDKSGNFKEMSGNFCHLTHVRELSGNFIMTLFLDWNLHHMIGALPVLCLCKCLLGKYKLKVYWLLLLNICLSKILGMWRNCH